jgi:hypothetical protein
MSPAKGNIQSASTPFDKTIFRNLPVKRTDCSPCDGRINRAAGQNGDPRVWRGLCMEIRERPQTRPQRKDLPYLRPRRSSGSNSEAKKGEKFFYLKDLL